MQGRDHKTDASLDDVPQGADTTEALPVTVTILRVGKKARQ